MKWFKHYSDMHGGRTVGNLLEEMGHTGLCFFLLQEICAEKLEKKVDETLTDADCLFSFLTRNVRQTLRISQVNLARLLAICKANGQLDYKFVGNELEISMPILLDLLDSDSKNSRTRRANAAKQSRLEEDKELELNKEVEKEKEKDSFPVLEKLPAKVRQAALCGCIPEFSSCPLSVELLSTVKQDAQRVWLATYPNDKWLMHEFRKAKAWLVTNADKSPKKNIARFLNNWLSNGFESYRKGLASKTEPRGSWVEEHNRKVMKQLDEIESQEREVKGES